ncbi:exonuclease SbcCD subunit D [Camelimonas abortus]|uniref:Exonuclease SbcCD subunit D n=1 Tax=Camelimonas abortus TaxID=1017184 RepID=A0ABV7LAK0_9HYPH
MAFRFVHAADIHLDSPLRSLALRDPAAAALVGDATREALRRIVDLCLEEQADALVLAGDLYDGAQTSMKTALFLAGELRRLDEAGVRVYLIRGNHDAASRITRELSLPPNVHVFDGRATPVEAPRPPGATPVFIHGVSFAQPHAPESLLPKFRPPVHGAINIGVMHTSLGGAEGHDAYAPCALADLDAHGFDYWALGHIHKRSVHRGRSVIVMPGNPQGRDINEPGPRSVTLVAIGDDRSVTLEERVTSVAEFARAEVDLTGVDSRAGVNARLHEALAALRAGVASPYLLARLRLGGATPLAGWARRDADRLLGEAMEAAQRLEGCFIDRLEISPQLREPAAPAGDGADPRHELAAIVESQVLASPAFANVARGLLDAIVPQLPAELRDAFDPGAEEGRAALLAELAREGAAETLAHLAAEDEGAGD